jgi:hypothetical protein
MQAYDDDPLGAEDAFGASRAAFEALTATLGSDEAGGWTCDQLEDHVQAHGRELLRRLLQDHLDPRALRERHAVQRARQQGQLKPVTDAQGICHGAVEPGHTRRLATVVGTVQVARCAWRADGARNLHPADAALNLPERLHSHTLQRHAAVEAVRGSFEAAHQAITRACGNVAGKRQVEQLTVAVAADIDAFYQVAAPQPSSDDMLLVASVDGKGVATLGVVYDADPAPRRPHDVITLATTDTQDGGGRRRRAGPTARGKWLTGSIATTSQQVIASVFDQAAQRDPTHRRRWIVLVDGARHNGTWALATT